MPSSTPGMAGWGGHAMLRVDMLCKQLSSKADAQLGARDRSQLLAQVSPMPCAGPTSALEIRARGVE